MANSITGKAELLLDTQSVLGEGSVWDGRMQQLFWVDIEGKRLFRYRPSTGEMKQRHFDEMIGVAVPTETGKLLMAMESGLASYDFDNDKLTRHEALKNDDSVMRYNDGKVGPNGNFWVGSMHKHFEIGTGNLYRVTGDFKVEIQIPETTISNGMAWTEDRKKFYFIDTAADEVWQYDYEVESAQIANKKVLFRIPESHGGADGMCIDSEGMLWIAHWGGHCIRRWHPDTGETLERIVVPAPHVTCCCFGGQNLDTLYITTARSGLTEAQLKEFPLSGGLFTFKPGVMGTPINYFKDN